MIGVGCVRGRGTVTYFLVEKTVINGKTNIRNRRRFIEQIVQLLRQ